MCACAAGSTLIPGYCVRLCVPSSLPDLHARMEGCCCCKRSAGICEGNCGATAASSFHKGSSVPQPFVLQVKSSYSLSHATSRRSCKGEARRQRMLFSCYTNLKISLLIFYVRIQCERVRERETISGSHRIGHRCRRRVSPHHSLSPRYRSLSLLLSVFSAAAARMSGRTSERASERGKSTKK